MGFLTLLVVGPFMIAAAWQAVLGIWGVGLAIAAAWLAGLVVARLRWPAALAATWRPPAVSPFAGMPKARLVSAWAAGAALLLQAVAWLVVLLSGPRGCGAEAWYAPLMGLVPTAAELRAFHAGRDGCIAGDMAGLGVAVLSVAQPLFWLVALARWPKPRAARAPVFGAWTPSLPATLKGVFVGHIAMLLLLLPYLQPVMSAGQRSIAFYSWFPFVMAWASTMVIGLLGFARAFRPPAPQAMHPPPPAAAP